MFRLKSVLFVESSSDDDRVESPYLDDIPPPYLSVPLIAEQLASVVLASF
jgi:hypothetical protein